MRPEAGRFLAGAFCLAATNAFGFAIPAVLQRAIDRLHLGGEAAGVLEATTRAALLIAALAALQAVIRTASRVLVFNAGRNIEYGLRRDLFGLLTRRSPAFFQGHPTGDLMSRLTNDLSAVRMLFGPGILNVVNTALVYGLGLWLLWRLSPTLTAVALLPLPLVVLVARIGGRAVHRTSRALQDELGRMSSTLQEDLAGISVVRAYALEPLREARFRLRNDALFRRSMALARARGALSPVFALVGGLGTLIVLWLGGKEVIAGRMTVGELVAFNAYLVYLSWPTIALGWVLAMWQRGLAAWARVRELLAAAAGDAGVPEGDSEPPAEASVRIQDLTVERGGRRVLDGVTLSVPPGRLLAVVGRTGSGKSTLADALLGFVEVPPGTVFVGGRDVRTLPPRALRAAIGYAPQEAFLFSATVAENIAFGRRGVPLEEASRAAIADAAEAAGLGRDIASFPDGYDTMVGERGITLSGGQRQRVALARALHADPRILVLDDSLSSVDTETERDILARLGPHLTGRTAVVISHRLAAVRGADEIVVLDAGRVVERGTHEALMAAGGVYASLYREQLEGPSAGRAA